MRGHFFAILLGLAALAAPARAAEPQTDLKLSSDPIDGQQPAAGGSKFGGQVYRALRDGAPEAAGAYMRDAINSLGGVCTDVDKFQRVASKPKVISYKVRCGSKPLYLLTVDEIGNMVADGGDGRVPAMLPSDGEIIDGKTGAPVGQDSAGGGGGGTPGNDEIPVEDVKKAGPAATTSVGAPQGGGSKKLKLVIVAFAVTMIAGALIFVLKFTGKSGVAPKASNAPRKYPSELKDAMIAESPEIAPDVWAHQSGIYIVRGKHGKRRVFAHRWNAMIYHRWGYKILQLR